MLNTRPIELLAPAANPSSGILAISAGADALYIGGAAFGARKAAGNSQEQIAQLVQYAHQFGVRVYQTINTLLLDDELSAVERMAWQAWEAGVDALIIQDMALLRMNLPPIALHASTQTTNMTLEKVRFLESVGFRRVILERAITLDEIHQIHRGCEVELELFVHGAICVSYSGRCTLGHALCARGGNRGACAQPCRGRYKLIDENLVEIAPAGNYLSMGDMNLSNRLDQVIQAGITSLKIEGRLKDQNYVINNTAHYNRLLSQYPRSSQGKVELNFEPNPEKSFSRSFTEYFIDGPRASVAAQTKSLGETIGLVVAIEAGHFKIDSDIELHAGDGICFMVSGDTVVGTNINSVKGQWITPNRMDDIKVGAKIYRNFDKTFQLSDRSAKRTIEARIMISHEAVTAIDLDGNQCVEWFSESYPIANNPEKSADTIRTSMIKSGGTIFQIAQVDILEPIPFIAIAELNRLRRVVLDGLVAKRLQAYSRQESLPEDCQAIYPESEPQPPISNRLASDFYSDHGLEDPKINSVEVLGFDAGVVLQSRYCIRREMGICLKNKGVNRKKLYLENNSQLMELVFDCVKCEMSIKIAR